MQPLTYPLAFDEGVLGSADFTVSLDLPVTQAKISIFPGGDFLATPTVVTCTVVTNSIQVRVPGTVTDILGAGRHAYQLDALSSGEQVRIARGELVVAPGVRTAFT